MNDLIEMKISYKWFSESAGLGFENIGDCYSGADRLHLKGTYAQWRALRQRIASGHHDLRGSEKGLSTRTLRYLDAHLGMGSEWAPGFTVQEGRPTAPTEEEVAAHGGPDSRWRYEVDGHPHLNQWVRGGSVHWSRRDLEKSGLKARWFACSEPGVDCPWPVVAAAASGSALWNIGEDSR